jgi:hypothetical protein
MSKITVIETKLYHIEDFIAQLKRNNIDQAFRSHKTSIDLKYGAWSPETQTFLTCSLQIPQIAELARIFTKLTQYHQSDPFKTNDEYLWTEVSSKVKFIDVLKGLGAAEDYLKEFKKVAVSDLRRVIDESSREEEVITVTRNTKVHERRIPIDWCGAKEVVCHMELSRNSVDYTIIFEGWRAMRRQLIEQQEGPFIAAGINLVDGEVSIATRY